MSRSQASLLAYEIKKNPKLAEIKENIEYYSEEEIMALPYLKWIRQALAKEKKIQNETINNSQLILLNKNNIIDGFMPDPMGQMRQWIAEDQYVALIRGFLLVKTGELIWISEQNIIWFDTIKSTKSYSLVIASSQFIANLTKSKYKEAHKERNLFENSFETNIQSIDAASSGSLSQYGVKFSR